MSEDRERFIETLNQDVQSQGDFYPSNDPKEIFEFVQKDFSNAMEHDQVLESYDTFEGTRFITKNNDGEISSYFRNNENQVVRSTPKQDVIDTYSPKPKADRVSASKNLMGKIFGESGGY